VDELVSRQESLDPLGPGTPANVGSVCAFDDASAPDLTVAETLAVYRLVFGQHPPGRAGRVPGCRPVGRRPVAPGITTPHDLSPPEIENETPDLPVTHPMTLPGTGLGAEGTGDTDPLTTVLP